MAAERPLSALMASIRSGEQWARRENGSLSGGHERSLAAPPAASRNPSAHGRSPGLRRIADAAFPNFRKSSGEKSVGTPLTVAGAATDQRKGLPCSLFTLGRNRGTVLPVCVPASRGVVKWSANRFPGLRSRRSAPPMLQSLRPGRLRTSKKDRPGLRAADLRAAWGANLAARIMFAAPTTLSCWPLRPRDSQSGRRYPRPLDDYPRQTAFRRIDAPFRAAAGRERPEWSPTAEADVRKRKIWR